MKICYLPPAVATIIFDIDSTLYTNETYAFEQNDTLIRRLAQERGISYDECRHIIATFKKKWAATHNGKELSLGNIFIEFGIPIETSIAWRKELFMPEKYLQKDATLFKTLSNLKKKYKLICITNCPACIGKKTLEALGVANLIEDIIGLDTCGKSKPAQEPLLLAMQKTNTPAENCVSVGDRYDIDVALPLEMGMGGILVSGVSDVYMLSKILK
ncbi:MAG: HAD family hydrolase [Treponema sp.]|nr:HAD family hydrolase [Treponema sp.]